MCPATCSATLHSLIRRSIQLKHMLDYWFSLIRIQISNAPSHTHTWLHTYSQQKRRKVKALLMHGRNCFSFISVDILERTDRCLCCYYCCNNIVYLGGVASWCQYYCRSYSVACVDWQDDAWKTVMEKVREKQRKRKWKRKSVSIRAAHYSNKTHAHALAPSAFIRPPSAV